MSVSATRWISGIAPLILAILSGCAAPPPGLAPVARAAPVAKGAALPSTPTRSAPAAATDKALAGHIQLGLGYLSQNDRK